MANINLIEENNVTMEISGDAKIVKLILVGIALILLTNLHTVLKNQNKILKYVAMVNMSPVIMNSVMTVI